MVLRVRPAEPADRPAVDAFLHHWNSDVVARRGELVDACRHAALLAAIDDVARRAGCRRLQLITTNDNVEAIQFYQRRGFRLVTAYPGAVDESRRRLKPGIPEVGAHSIPILTSSSSSSSCEQLDAGYMSPTM